MLFVLLYISRCIIVPSPKNNGYYYASNEGLLLPPSEKNKTPFLYKSLL